MELKSVSKSTLDLNVHFELLPRDWDGTSEIAFLLPSMCIGVRGHACWVFNWRARACIRFLAIDDFFYVSRMTHPMVGKLSLNNVTCFLRRLLHTPSITSHSISRPAISRSEFDIFPFVSCTVVILVLISVGHSHQNTVGVHTDISPNTTPPTP